MAPEQIQGKRSDPRSDIYTIGVLLYLASTGKLPFSSKQRSLQNWVQHKAKFVAENNDQDDLPPELIDIILKALASSPGKRYQWVEDLREDLEKVFL